MAEIPANIFEALPDRNAWKDRDGWHVFPSSGDIGEFRQRVEMTALVGLRHDCTFPGCQLSAGHPPPHCLPAAGGRYQMVDDNGNILREL